MHSFLSEGTLNHFAGLCSYRVKVDILICRHHHCYFMCMSIARVSLVFVCPLTQFFAHLFSHWPTYTGKIIVFLTFQTLFAFCRTFLFTEQFAFLKIILIAFWFYYMGTILILWNTDRFYLSQSCIFNLSLHSVRIFRSTSNESQI